jgi:putative tryptophan/tyrosine transport system substrate-binding protein
VALLINTLAPKQLQLLREVLPTATLVGFLTNPKSPIVESDTREVQSAASTTGQKILVVSASGDGELDTAFTALVQQHAQALLVMSDPFLKSRIEKIVALAARLCPASDVSISRISNGRRSDELWNGSCRRISSNGHLCRKNS